MFIKCLWNFKCRIVGLYAFLGDNSVWFFFYFGLSHPDVFIFTAGLVSGSLNVPSNLWITLYRLLFWKFLAGSSFILFAAGLGCNSTMSSWTPYGQDNDKSSTVFLVRIFLIMLGHWVKFASICLGLGEIYINTDFWLHVYFVWIRTFYERICTDYRYSHLTGSPAQPWHLIPSFVKVPPHRR